MMIELIKEFIYEQLANNQFAQGGIVIAALSSLLYYAKSWPKFIWDRISRKIIFNANIEHLSDLYEYFEVWLSHHHNKSYRNVEANVIRSYEENRYPSELPKHEADLYYNPDKALSTENTKTEELNVKQYSDSFTIFYKGRLLLIRKGREKFENASNFQSAFYNNFSIRGIFAKNAIKSLLKEVIEFNQQFKSTKIRIYNNNGMGDWMSVDGVKPKPIEKVILEDRSLLLSDIDDFINSREWYNDRCIPYKRGYLLHGSPGNGKTTICLSLAEYLKRDIYVLNLNGLNDEGVKRAFRNMMPDAILVLEDIDSAFTNRKAKKAKCSFSTLLNCLDGVYFKENSITIMTTNHIEKLDPALIRCGRADMKLKVDNPSKEQVEEYLSIFYNRDIKLVKYSDNKPMVDVQDTCLRNKNNHLKAIRELSESNAVVNI